MLKNLFDPTTRKKSDSVAVGEFAHQHKDLIIIVADPKDDTIFVAYKDRFASGRIRVPEGKDARVIRDMMKNSRLFDSEIDRFLMSLVDVLKINRLSFGVNNFLQFLDGALYNISQRHRKAAKGGPIEGAIKSPYVKAAGRSGVEGDLNK